MAIKWIDRCAEDSLEKLSDLDMDHIEPQSKDGADSVNDMQSIHPEYNGRRKEDKRDKNLT